MKGPKTRSWSHPQFQPRLAEVSLAEEMPGGLRCPAACLFDHGGSCGCLVAQGKEMRMMGFSLSERPSFELLRNCDLPPPAKLFTGEKDAPLRDSPSPLPSAFNMSEEEDEEGKQGVVGGDKMDLLKALHLSQTRAREAEKKNSLLSIEKDGLTSLFLKESSLLFAHRQWIRLLEMEILHLKSQIGFCRLKAGKQVEEKNDDGADASCSWWTLLICIGFASFGVALGCTCSF